MPELSCCRLQHPCALPVQQQRASCFQPRRASVEGQSRRGSDSALTHRVRKEGLKSAPRPETAPETDQAEVLLAAHSSTPFDRARTVLVEQHQLPEPRKLPGQMAPGSATSALLWHLPAAADGDQDAILIAQRIAVCRSWACSGSRRPGDAKLSGFLETKAVPHP